MSLVQYSFHIGEQVVHAGILVGVGILLFINGFIYLNRKRLIQNLPTSKISVLALGLVEIKRAMSALYS